MKPVQGQQLNVEEVVKTIYNKANQGVEDFCGTRSKNGKIGGYKERVEKGYEAFLDFSDNHFGNNKKVKDHSKLIGGLFGWIRKLANDSAMSGWIETVFCRGKNGTDQDHPKIKISDINLESPDNALTTSYNGELQVSGLKISEEEIKNAKRILAPISGQKHKFVNKGAEPTPFFWEIWDARETSGASKGGLSSEQAKKICDAIADTAVNDAENGKEILGAIDVLMSATQIMPIPDEYKENTKIDDVYKVVTRLYSSQDQDKTTAIKTELDENANILKNARKQWLDSLISKIVDQYLKIVENMAIEAINAQAFSFRKGDGTRFTDTEIRNFYNHQGETEGDKLKNFTLGKNLDKIKEGVESTLSDFDEKIKKIAKAYNDEFDLTGNVNQSVVRPWRDAISNGAQVVESLLNDKINSLNARIEAKSNEKLDYLTALLRESAFYLKDIKPLPTFLLDPADSFTELGICYDPATKQDNLFKDLDYNEVVERLSKFRFDLKDYPTSELDTAGFAAEETDQKIKDNSGNDTGKKYYTLKLKDDFTRNKANHIKEFFKSEQGRPRQVPNIFFNDGKGGQPQQIYSREFLAVYQKGLVEEIKNSGSGGEEKRNKIQVKKCYFFTGEGKTHVVKRIINDIEFKKNAEKLLNPGKDAPEVFAVLDFNLQNDDLEEIKRKILIEALVSVGMSRSSVEETLNKIVSDKNNSKINLELISLKRDLTSQLNNKKINFIIQADEDPHMSAAVKQFFYSDVYDFLAEECGLKKDGSTGALGTINLISISGTPKQKRHDHMVDKVLQYYNKDSEKDNWFNGANKSSQYLHLETGKKEIRALENFKNAYKNISGLFGENAVKPRGDSIEERISNSIKGVSDKKKTSDARHIQYLMPDLSPTDSVLLFAPERLEALMKEILSKQGIANENEFFVLLPPVSDSVAKVIRDRVANQNLTGIYADYIDLLEKKKTVKFTKINNKWTIRSVSEGKEKDLDKEENSTKDCLCFYDQNSVIGGDYGKFSRDVTDFFIDDLSGREFGTDDLAQWIARNRTMNLREKTVAKGVQDQCSFYYVGTQKNLERIKKNAENSAELVEAQFNVINAWSDKMDEVITKYNEIKESGLAQTTNYSEISEIKVKPANDNDLTPLKKIQERINRIFFDSEDTQKAVLEELDKYAEGESIFSNLDVYDPDSEKPDPLKIDSGLFHKIIVYCGGEKALLGGKDGRYLSLGEEGQKEINRKIQSAELYAKEYIEAQVAIRKKSKERQEVEVSALPLFNGDKGVEYKERNSLSKLIESGRSADDRIAIRGVNDCLVRDIFSSRNVWIKGIAKLCTQKDKIQLFAQTLEREFKKSGVKFNGKNIWPNETILDLFDRVEDKKYSRSDVKQVLQSQDIGLTKYLNVTLDRLDGNVGDFVKKIEPILTKLKGIEEQKIKKQSSGISRNRLKDAVITEIKDVNDSKDVTVAGVKVYYFLGTEQKSSEVSLVVSAKEIGENRGKTVYKIAEEKAKKMERDISALIELDTKLKELERAGSSLNEEKLEEPKSEELEKLDKEIADSLKDVYEEDIGNGNRNRSLSNEGRTNKIAYLKRKKKSALETKLSEEVNKYLPDSIAKYLSQDELLERVKSQKKEAANNIVNNTYNPTGVSDHDEYIFNKDDQLEASDKLKKLLLVLDKDGAESLKNKLNTLGKNTAFLLTITKVDDDNQSNSGDKNSGQKIKILINGAVINNDDEDVIFTIKNFKSAEYLEGKVIAYPESSPGEGEKSENKKGISISEKLSRKRKKEVIGEKEPEKVQLYYVKSGSGTDCCFVENKLKEENPNENAIIPHLVMQLDEKDQQGQGQQIQDGDQPKARTRRVIDTALSGSAYKRQLQAISFEDKEDQNGFTKCLKEYQPNGLTDNVSGLISDDQNLQLKDDNSKTLEDALSDFLSQPVITPVNADGINFTNVIERKDAKVKDDKNEDGYENYHLVKVTFLVDEVKGGDKIQIPKDAPKVRFVQVNGTGLLNGSKILKLKFFLDDNGQLNYGGVYEQKGGDLQPVRSFDDIERYLLDKMKVVATKQVVSKIQNQDPKIKIDQILALGKADDFKKKNLKVIESNANNTLTSSSRDDRFENTDFEMKPNSQVRCTEVESLVNFANRNNDQVL